MEPKDFAEGQVCGVIRVHVSLWQSNQRAILLWRSTTAVVVL